MPLLLTFLVMAILGQALNMFLAIQVERHVSEAAGVIVFFALLVIVFIVAWKLAVRLTEAAAPGRRAAQHPS
jgi:hypothetical protein